MKQLVTAGELEHLSQERVWTELEKILGEKDAFLGLVVLNNCGALRTVLCDPNAQAMLDFVGRKGINLFNAMGVMDKFIALTHAFGYDAKWMHVMRIPSTVQKGYLMFNKVSDRFAVFDDLSPATKVQFLMDVGAFNNADTFGEIAEVLHWFAPTAKFTTFMRTVNAAKTVDCEAVALANKSNVATAIFVARTEAVEKA
jgi:hypothetical protein